MVPTALLALTLSLAALARPDESAATPGGAAAVRRPEVEPRALLARLAAADRPIGAVQAAAARAADRATPDPSALAARRRWAALLPHLTAELRRDERSYRVVGLQGSSEVDYVRSSPGTTVVVRATWDLGDLVASRGEPAAASAALSRARRRDDAVRRATSLYYERRRLLVALALDPPADPRRLAELELELDQVSASLEAVVRGAAPPGEPDEPPGDPGEPAEGP
jgi:hypothetical protein